MVIIVTIIISKCLLLRIISLISVQEELWALSQNIKTFVWTYLGDRHPNKSFLKKAISKIQPLQPRLGTSMSRKFRSHPMKSKLEPYSKPNRGRSPSSGPIRTL